MSNVVNIDRHDKFKGKVITTAGVSDIMKEKTLTTYLEDLAIKQQSSSSENNGKGGFYMDTEIKGYIDHQINNLEKSFNQRIDSQEKLLSEKIDHLHTKTEKTINDSLNNFKDSFEKSRKEDRKFLITIAVSIIALTVGALKLFL